ncbi:hypothetical protein ACIRU8_06910 [Streptomyces sp. NPDC101175]|uniref:hypothetical protein n=1 Tax=Streptomyces sp. NPDC101175 TaxID=3366123 RepID=UPI003834C6AF
MLNYLATALPGETGAGARLLALQCALRMNDSAQVRLPYGVLRSLRLGAATGAWHELNETGLLCTRPSDHRAMTVEIIDAGLLSQHPARPDRLRAADWALRGVCPALTGSAPLLQLAALCFVVRTDHGSDHGLAETEDVARECGVPAAALPSLLDQLVTAGVFAAWQVVLDTGELSWRLKARGPHPHAVSEGTH